MNLSGAEITIKLLELLGIDTIAGIPGGANLPLYDALYKSNISHILARHEQGAAFIAQGIARSTGKAAVCFATSGPGATNLLTAIADAKLDSIPLIAITGQVPYYAVGTDAFQEVDTYGLTIPITKHNFFIHSIEELFDIIPEAFRIAEDGRPGPVVIDIPKNIQTQIYEFNSWPEIKQQKSSKMHISSQDIDTAVNLINSSKKPILYVGGGIINAECSHDLFKLAKKNSIPATTTLMALGSFPYHDELYLGMLGMHGARFTNLLLNEADLIIALGVRFDDRAVCKISEFSPNAKIIHVDIDESEINKLKKVDLSIIGDISIIIKYLIKKVDLNPRENWLKEVANCKKSYPLVLPAEEDLFHPINIIKQVSKFLDEDAIISTDVGQHQMWTAQIYPFNKPRTLLTSGGLGTMGFGLPAAIGAALANPDKQIVCFSGDGSILMNIQELATLCDLNLNIKIIILNNNHLGLVKQQQELFYDKHFIASKFITKTNFALVAKGFGLNSCNLNYEQNPIAKLEYVLSLKEPYVINIDINPEENVFPMVPPGESLNNMIGGENI
ncbi:biosynthetic-type acetolactate synthase large subunit [Clostridium paridis]|uniref:Acetolactate synthase n=1 Tax=Clostridium paridis TaxID=2803863 RepID=A0A937FH24_9CLOT|nr:biosynthetic-type acetolactate synthase large subunit [Clostridium paridis]MBL4931296.1 biosynthetic-type acetolactate synthase large subunit [Clostridium paridis]